MQHVAVAAGVVALDVLGVAAALRNHLAAVQEQAGDAHGLVQEAARIVAQVDHQALHLRVLGLEVLDGVGGLLGGLLVEGRDAQIAVVAFHMALGRLHIDRLAHQLDVEGVFAGAHDGQGDRLADRAAHLLDRIRQLQADHALAVDGGDIVAGLDPGPRRRGVVHGRDHLDRTLVAGHLDAQAAVFAAGLVAHVAIVIGVQIARVRIQRGQHAVDRRLDQLLVVDRRHILVLDRGQHVAEQLQHAEGLGLGRVRHRRPVQVRHASGAEDEGRNTDQEIFAHHRGPRHPTCLFQDAKTKHRPRFRNPQRRAVRSGVLSQSAGSTGAPFLRISR